MNYKLIKLSKELLQLSEIMTDKGLLVYSGPFVTGTEVAIEKDGEWVKAEGEFIIDNQKIIIEEGIIKEILDIEPIEEPAPIVEEPIIEEPITEDEPAIDYEAIIAEKEATIADLKMRIVELEMLLDENKKMLEANLKMSADIPAKEKIKNIKTTETKFKLNQF